MGDRCFCLFPPHLAWGVVAVRAHASLKTCVFVIVLWVLWPQAPFSLRVRCLVGLSLGRNLISQRARYTVQSLCSSRKCWKLEVPSWLYSAVVGWDLWDSFYQPFLPASVWIVSHLPDVSELLSNFLDFFQGELLGGQPYVQHVCHEGKFRKLLCHYLCQLSSYEYNLKKMLKTPDTENN